MNLPRPNLLFRARRKKDQDMFWWKEVNLALVYQIKNFSSFTSFPIHCFNRKTN
jgi:hypothetical protein